MRVLHVIPSIATDQGGLRTGTLATCRAQLVAGMHPEIACLHGEADEIPVHRFKPGLRLLGASAEMHDWLLAHARDYDAIIAHVVWLNPAHYAANAAAKAGMPLYLASRGMLDPDALSHHRLRKLIRWHTGVRKLIGGSVLVFSSSADRDRSLSHLELKGAAAVVVPNAVEIPAAPGQGLAPFPTAETEPDPGPIVCLNRLHPRKGVLEWVAALAQLHAAGVQFRAVHAGHEEDRDYAAAVRRAARGLGGALEFRGAVNNAQALEVMASAQIVIHPATGFENFGNVIVEGMAAAKPVIASRRALVTPQLEQARVVIGVEPTPGQLADAMRSLLEDSAARAELGSKARAYAEKHFSFEAVGKRWLEILRG